MNCRMEQAVKRWLFNIHSWTPSQSQFSYCLSLLPSSHHADVLRFARLEDRKRALISRLMQFMLLHRLLGISFHDIVIKRTKEGKPFMENSHSRIEFENLNFNVSHHGDFVGLASEPLCLVGLDIVTIEVQAQESLMQYLKIFESYFTELEWSTILNAGPETSSLLNQFYRHWCMKESYVKAIGVGIGFDFKRAEFYYPDGNPWSNIACLRIDGKDKKNWRFHLQQLGTGCWACVAKGPPSEAITSFKATLAMSDLDAATFYAALDFQSEPFIVLSIYDLIPDVQKEKFVDLESECLLAGHKSVLDGHI